MFAHDADATRASVVRAVVDVGRRRAALRQARAGRRRPVRDRRRRGSRRAPPGSRSVNTVRALARRCRGAPTGAREPRRRPLGAGDQADRAAGRARRARGASRASRSSAPGVSAPASTRSRCCSRARPRSASGPRRSPTRARRCGSSTSSTRWCAHHGVARGRASSPVRCDGTTRSVTMSDARDRLVAGARRRRPRPALERSPRASRRGSRPPRSASSSTPRPGRRRSTRSTTSGFGSSPT